MAGRPSKFTPERVNRILESIRSGDPKGLAAKLAGIDHDTLNRWLDNPDYAEFAEAFKSAEAEAEKKYVDIIRVAAVDKWQAAAWILERRFSGNWAKANTEQPAQTKDNKPTYTVDLPADETPEWQAAGNA